MSLAISQKIPPRLINFAFFNGMMACSLILAGLLPVTADAVPQLQNITIFAPPGTSNHGDPHLLCTPTRTIDVALFFIGNYVAHAATVKALPGAPVIPAFLDLIFALFFPVSGIIRGLNAIYQSAALRQVLLKKTSLETAVRAGAVCEVVRTKFWRPQNGDELRHVQVKTPFEVPVDQSTRPIENLPHPPPRPPTARSSRSDRSGSIEIQLLEMREYARPEAPGCVVAEIQADQHLLIHEIPHFIPSNGWSSLTGRKIHGVCDLPEGYALAAVPMDADVRPIHQNPQREPEAEDYVSPERYIVGWLFNLFGTHRYREKLEVLNRLGLATESDEAWLRRLGRLERRFPPPKLPGEGRASSSEFSSFYSASKGLIAVIQLVFASYTVYRTKGDQLSRYGYAAFGLTVAPYLIMSFVNLLSSLLTPDYSHMYLVSSDVMEEARNHGGHFEGEIGHLDTQQQRQPANDPDAPEQLLTISVRFHVANDYAVSMELPAIDDQHTAVAAFGEPGPGGFYTVIWARVDGRVDPKVAKLQSRSRNRFNPIHTVIYFFKYLRKEMRSHGSGPFPSLTLVREALRDVIDRKDQSNLAIPSTSQPLRRQDQRGDYLRTIALIFGSIWIGCMSLIVVGSLSHFHQGSSTHAQRAWTMSWLAAGIFIGPISYLFPTYTSLLVKDPAEGILYKLGLLLYAAPAIGGFVVVNQMLWDYGRCIQIY